MEQDYITLGGIRYRARFNWNALTGFLAETGQDSIEALNHFKVTPSSITILIWHGLREGERIEGREFTLTKEDIGAQLTVPMVEQVMAIFMRHNGVNNTEEGADGTKKKTRNPFRRSAKSVE